MSDPAGSSQLFIGLMSGTSLDSIDAALVDFSQQPCRLIDCLEHPLPTALRDQLIGLCQPGDNEIERMGSADNALGHEFARAVNALLTKTGNSAADIVAIGSHGQTIRHRPELANRFTLQIGDANIISHQTGIDTVADFRRKDMAANGQGAPLAPAFHQAMFSSSQHNRAIINIGGMANISCLSRDQQTLGFDTGPGNILMDGWIQQQKNQRYDRDGQWAASGTVSPALLNKLLSHPFLAKKLPKSTGREDFCLPWLQQMIGSSTLAAEDVQATLLEFTAQTICGGVTILPSTIDEVYICGGGAYNSQLMQRLEHLLQPRLVANTAALGIAAEWVEAAAFAWLAKQTLARKPGNLSSVTGADNTVVLGAIFPA
jgi:anhydro-N-acetylmuramic acid kinase